MKLAEIRTLPNCPNWLKDTDIKVKNESMFISNAGFLVWEKGTWKNGTWENGIWEGGIWKGGIWKGGIWKDGIWKDGTWKDGIWESGTWKSGTWEDGYMHLVGKCKWEVFYNVNKKIVIIGCKKKTLEEWEHFFTKTTDTYETERNTRQFDDIEKMYKIAKFIIEGNNV